MSLRFVPPELLINIWREMQNIKEDSSAAAASAELRDNADIENHLQEIGTASVPELDAFTILPFPSLKYFDIEHCNDISGTSSPEATSSVEQLLSPFMSLSKDEGREINERIQVEAKNRNGKMLQQIIPGKILRFMNQPVTEDNPIIQYLRCVMCEKFPIFERFTCGGSQSHLLCRGCVVFVPKSAKQKKAEQCRRRENKLAAKAQSNFICPFVQTGEEEGTICGSRIMDPVSNGLTRTLIESSTFACPFDQCQEFGTGSADGLQMHMKTCGYRRSLRCHLDCGSDKFSLIHYLPHLIDGHKIPIFETDQATLFLEYTAKSFFTKDHNYKYHGLGIFNVFSKHFLIVAAEIYSKYWLYAVILDRDDYRDESTLEQFYCSFEMKPPSFDEDDHNNVEVTQELDLSMPPTNFETVEKFEYTLTRDSKRDDFHRLMKLPLFSEMSRDKVLSLEESTSGDYDMTQVFQLEKKSGKFYWAGVKKMRLNVIIHRTNEADVNPSFGKFATSLPKSDDEHSDEMPQSTISLPYDDDWDHLGPERAAEIKRKKMKEHQALLRGILESERATPFQLQCQSNYKGNFGDVKMDHFPLALFKPNLFS